jgi:tartrate-resistant acid phosphatase type 5
MKPFLMLFFLLFPLIGFTKAYPILDVGDPDLTAEKKDSKNYKANLEINVNQKPFAIKNPQTFFERGVLKNGHRICLVGDTGNGSKRQKMIASLMNKNCDQIRHVGDIIYYTGLKDRQDPLLARFFLDIYKDMKVPMYLVMGNHDYYKNPDVWLEVAKEFPQKYIFPNNYYMEFFSLPSKRGLCFISLDTNPFNDAASINAPRVSAQIKWLDTLPNLIKNRCTKTFSFSHHPFIPAGAGRDEKSSDILKNDLFEKRLLNYVDMVIAGHDHFLAYYSKLPKAGKPGQFHKVSEIISGTGGMLNTETPVEPRNYGQVFRETGFIQMTLNGSSDNPQVKGTFRFINHLGKEIYRFEGP